MVIMWKSTPTITITTTTTGTKQRGFGASNPGAARLQKRYGEEN